MKKMFMLSSIIAILTVGSQFVYALSYTGADITLKGDEYSNIIEVNDPAHQKGWFTTGDGALRTAWQGQWVDYEVELIAGNWNIGLNVINSGLLGHEGWYDQFEVLNSLTNEVMTIKASDTEEQYGFFNTDIVSAGTYTVRFTWLNDKMDAPLDANIQINGMFFDDTSTLATPEPGTLILLSLGLIGLARLRRK